tara:strand:+ start:8372 stop:9310 length:939 start_codon:yes stop_codon:yes gene_type:complete
MFNISIIGYGYWGKKLARNFQNSSYFDILSIVDKKKINLIDARKNLSNVECYSNYKNAIQNDLLDLIVISTPTSTHYDIAKFALENSKHILVEKPLSLSLKQVDKLNNIAKTKKRMIFVDYPFLFSGTINYIKKVISQNKFGKILEIESFREQAPIRNDTNVIWDLTTHDVSILTYLLRKQPRSIQTIKKENIKKGLCDNIYVNLKYDKNLNVLVKNSWISPTKIRLIKIKFNKAILYCDENESLYKIKIYKKRDKKGWSDYSLEIPEIDLTEPLSKMTTYIYNSIKKNKNFLFAKDFNKKITMTLEKINKN